MRDRGVFFGDRVARREVGDLVLVDCRHAADSRLPRHGHELAYFCVNHGGTYTEEYGRRRRRVCGPGMVVFHPAGEMHRQVHQGAPVASLNVEVGAAWLNRMAEFAGPLDQPAEFCADEIAAAGLQLLREFQSADTDSALAIESLCWEILAASLDRRQPASPAATPRWLREARDSLQARLGESPTLRGLAEEAAVHPVYFAATFRRFYGCSVGEYLRRERLRRARRELADPDRSLAEVAADCGFADQSHFTRTFKRFTGLTPGAYRTFLPFKTR